MMLQPLAEKARKLFPPSCPVDVRTERKYPVEERQLLTGVRAGE